MARLLALSLVAVVGWSAQDAPQMPKPTKEHEWLQQLVGEWDSDVEIAGEPGAPLQKLKGTESGRMMGGF